MHMQHDGIVLNRQLKKTVCDNGKMRISCVLSTFLGFCGAKGTVGSESHQIPSPGGVAFCSHSKVGGFILNYSRVAAQLDQKTPAKVLFCLVQHCDTRFWQLKFVHSVETSEETSFLPELPRGILREWSRRLSITSQREMSTGTRAWSGVFISLNQLLSQ